jgi:hypothetical protein
MLPFAATINDQNSIEAHRLRKQRETAGKVMLLPLVESLETTAAIRAAAQLLTAAPVGSSQQWRATT